MGVNCHFDPTISLQTVKLMKEGLQAAGLKAHLMSQPLAYHTPDCGKQGFIDLPEFPFGKTHSIHCLDVFAFDRFQINLELYHSEEMSAYLISSPQLFSLQPQIP